MKIIDTSDRIREAYDGNGFNMDRWKLYIDSCVPGAGDKCIDDMEKSMAAGYSFEEFFLPVLNAVQDEEKFKRTVETFRDITEDLEERIIKRFHRSLSTDLILYLGLGNGAGWVTKLNGKEAVLFGIEKIIELGWYEKNAMIGLVYHELGHVYQNEYGVLHREFSEQADRFMWQLFTEGVAMVFEQEILGDPDYFHQYDDEWRKWCNENLRLIRDSFKNDISVLSDEDQCYFGDWVSFRGHGDTGYYLGARFVRFLLKKEDFDRIILYDIDDVKKGFERFMEQQI